MKKLLATNDFISLLSKRARFTKGDIKFLLDVLVEILEELSKDGIILRVRGLGKLYYSRVPARKISAYTDKFGVFHPEKVLPESRKVIFKLASNIRYPGEIDSNIKDLDKDEEV